jgi:hypothetical protein
MESKTRQLRFRTSNFLRPRKGRPYSSGLRQLSSTGWRLGESEKDAGVLEDSGCTGWRRGGLSAVGYFNGRGRRRRGHPILRCDRSCWNNCRAEPDSLSRFRCFLLCTWNSGWDYHQFRLWLSPRWLCRSYRLQTPQFEKSCCREAIRLPVRPFNLKSGC